MTLLEKLAAIAAISAILAGVKLGLFTQSPSPGAKNDVSNLRK